jgi:hypothetical protein
MQNSTLTNKDARQKMSPSNARSLNYMKQKLKKNNKLYEEDIAKFKENPESEEEKETVCSLSPSTILGTSMFDQNRPFSSGCQPSVLSMSKGPAAACPSQRFCRSVLQEDHHTVSFATGSSWF